MIAIRKSEERGHIDHGWLNTFHTFSFSDYYDPEFMGFRTLRVINEDVVQPAEGFDTHGHRDMEIITYILDGELQHKDSMGNGSVITTGEVQYMSAGKGVQHSEFNASKSKAVHLLQIWILPNVKGAEPRYDQKTFAALGEGLKLIASPDGKDGSIAIRQDVRLYAAKLKKSQELTQTTDLKRFGWVQVARGKVELNGHELKAGDGAALAEEEELNLTGLDTENEILFFDLN